MREYHKIETLFERDNDGTKKLIEGKFRNKTVKMLKDCNWIFTEKINGTNIRVFWDGHNISYGGRTDRAQIPPRLKEKLDQIFMNNETEEMFEQKFGEKNVIFFGEGYGAGIQKGGAYREDVSFILFDVLVEDVWLERENVEDVAKSFGLEIVPIIFTGNLQKGVDFVKTNPKSTIGNANMEGLVARPESEILDRFGNRVIVKIKCRDFN